MSFKIIFDGNLSNLSEKERKKAAGRAAVKSARSNRNRVRNNMVFGKPSGKVYDREDGNGFTRRHRASRRGEAPAVYDGTLANRATKFKKTSDTSAETYIDLEIAPYAAELIEMERVIMTEQEQAAQEYYQNSDNEFTRLV